MSIKHPKQSLVLERPWDFFQQMGNGLWWTLIFPLKTVTVHFLSAVKRARYPLKDERRPDQGAGSCRAWHFFFWQEEEVIQNLWNLCFTLPVWETCMYMVRGLNKLSMFASTAPTLSEKTLVFQRSILTYSHLWSVGRLAALLAAWEQLHQQCAPTFPLEPGSGADWSRLPALSHLSCQIVWISSAQSQNGPGGTLGTRRQFRRRSTVIDSTLHQAVGCQKAGRPSWGAAQVIPRRWGRH